MVLCFIALPVLFILGIFSVKYRILAKEAFECAFRTVTFRRCKSGFDEKLKDYIVGKFIKRNQKLGLFVYKKFQLLSIIFTILILGSFFFSVTGFINYIKYGNCYGPGENNYFCPYSDIFGEKNITSPCNIEKCTNETCNCEQGETCICENGTCKNER